MVMLTAVNDAEEISQAFFYSVNHSGSLECYVSFFMCKIPSQHMFVHPTPYSCDVLEITKALANVKH